MRVAVIGAGAVGGTIAAVLHRGGHDVEVTARGAHLDAIRENGITLSGEWGDYIAPVEAHPRITRIPELAIVATKTLDAASALNDNADWLHGVPVVVIPNGITAITTAREVLPGTDIVGGLAVFAASLVEPGKVAITTSGSTYLGSTPVGGNDAQDAVEFVASVLGSVIPVHITRNFAGAQWTKLIVNQINALPAITGTSAQSTIADRGLRNVLTRSMREAVGVAIASGVRFEKMQGLSHGVLRAFRGAPLMVAQLLPLVMKWRMGRVPNPGSTLQSIRRGQKSEIDYLNGAIVDAARASGGSTPINSTLVDLVHEVESSGEFFTAAQVIARVNDAVAGDAAEPR
ncbi:MAG: 2-dehydropantoate 2-reductase [Microbacteriaceae bacterium]|nr:2-dehydropantoate 2-reductase [Microbacteriaceae bacterium]